MRSALLAFLAGALTVLFLAGCVDRSDGRSLEDDSEGLEPRGPIRLVGKAFTVGLGSGVRSGNGTLDDPYLISGWYIDLTASDEGGRRVGITLEDVDAYVHVSDCKVQRGSGDVAIHVHRSKHVTVEKCKVVTIPDPHLGVPTTDGPAPSTSSPTNESVSNSSDTSDLAPTTSSAATPEPQGTATPATSTQVVVLEPPSEPAVHIEGSANVTVIDMAVQGEAGDDGGGAPLVSIEDSDDVHLVDSQVEEGTGDGVLVEGSADVTVTGTDVTGNEGDGVVLANSTAVTVANNSISQNAGDGVHATQSEGSTVADNTVTGNGGYGVAVNSDNTVVVHNEVVGNGAGGGGGILVEGGSTTVAANGVHDNENYGIVVMEDAGEVDVADNAATGDDGGDRIIVPDPQDASLFSAPNEGRVEAPGPDFNPRPPPKGNSPGLSTAVLVGGVLVALGAAGAWWIRRAP